MNYYNFVNTILETAKSHKLVYEVGEGDIYEHLNSGDHKYPCVFLTVQNVDSNGDQMTVTGSLFYVDALLSDTSNKLQIQSTGMTTLQQIFMRLMDNYPDFDLRIGRYTPFDEKFADLCAGVFSNFTISFMDDTCVVNDDIFEGDIPTPPTPPEPEYGDWVLDKNSYIVGDDGQYYERLVRGVLTKPEVDLNNDDWKVNTVSTEYDVYDDFDYYMSDKNWHVYNSFSQCKISWKGTNRFNLKYRSSGDTWNYLVIGPLDGDKFETKPNDKTPGILATTRYTSNNQYIDLYIDCDEGEHHVWVAYIKSDTNSNDDRGYIGVPKQILSVKQEKQGNVLPNDYVASDSEYTKLDDSHLEINKIRRYILPNGTIIDNNDDTYKENILCDYLTYTLVDGIDSTVITLEGYNNEYNGKNISLEYQINDGNWVTWDLQKQITLTRNTNGNGYIKFRGVNPVWGEFIDGRYAVKLKSSSPVNVSGNILSLIGGEKTSNELNTSIFCLFMDSNIVDASKLLLLPLKFTKGSEYLGLFMNCYLLETPPELPCMSLYSWCYKSMFNGCRSLKNAPFLQCYRIPEGAYAMMFKGCVNLKESPSLPGLNVGKYSYESMFSGCTSLEKSTYVLPAEIVSESAYRDMFSGCTRLKECPEIKGIRVSKYSYQSMFENCKSIKTTPFLYPTEMSNCDLCYYAMFSGCTSLEKGPSVLPALRIRDSRMIYDSMFKNCVNLKECPKLPATSILTDPTLNLGTMEYESMFEGCVNITESPILPLEFIQKDTYKNMFKGCSKLQKVTCLATNITYYPTCTENWLEGVAEKGTFVKKSGTDWSSKEGYSGIPEGWTVEEI